jgi:cobalt-zinc-cadmium efflux system outer membrane protein
LSISIQNALNKFYLTKELSGKQEQAFYQDYGFLFNNITESYRQRQISLIEFIDFFDAYRDAELNHLSQDYNLHVSIEEINYLAGKDLIN